MDILEKARELIPTVRLAAGLPPLVTPTSQIVGAQAVNCALDIKAGKPMYNNVSNQFVGLVKGEYGKTPGSGRSGISFENSRYTGRNALRHVEVSNAAQPHPAGSRKCEISSQ